MKPFHLFYLLPALYFLSSINQPGEDPGDNIIAGLQKWHDNNPQEKIFVQTDREEYAAGETIWIKSWCTIDNKPGYLSRIFYTVLSDSAGRVIEKKMHQLDVMASGSGLIDLDKELKSGTYTLSAYTLWMQNFPQFIFRKTIFIYGNDFNQKHSLSKSNKNQFYFFPEGGDMIEAVPGQLAFKATNITGYPVNFKGAIFTSDGIKISEIQAAHDGMGVTDFEPSAGKTYLAKINFDNGQTAEYNLPAPKKEGIVLSVNNNSTSRISVLINRGDINKEKYNNIILIAQINGMPVYKAGFNFDNGETGASISKKNLPSGIMQLTAFDSTGNPLSERLVFINNQEIISPEISIDTLSTKKREQNKWSFRLDTISTPSLSVLVLNAAIDSSYYQKENLSSFFFLSSDIKGYIHNPGYYFSDKKPETLQNLDLLLMTQGWRRFNWKQIKGEEEIVLKYPVETFMNIAGKVTKSGKTEPVKDGFVTILTKAEDSTTILSNAKLNEKGEFILDSLVFRNKAKISIEGTDNNKKKIPVDVSIYPTHIDTLKHVDPLMLNMPATSSLFAENNTVTKHLINLLEIKDSFNSKVLSNVTVTAKKISKVDSLQKQYVSPVYEMSDQSLFLPDNKQYLNIWQFLNESVPGLYVNPFQPGGVTYASFSRYDGLSLTDSEQGIKFLLNEMPVSIDAIDVLNPGDIAFIKIYKGAMGFPLGAEAGAISVYTKKGTDVKAAVYDKTFSTTDKTGFALTREFYHPDYTMHPELNKNEKDNRLILYWNPNAKQNNAGDYQIRFHNNDYATSFKLIIQGIDINGRMIYKEQLVK